MVPRAQATKDVEVNGVRLQYIEQGSGEPIVFVHGAPHDLRAWEPVREEIAKKYRFIAYTQRYFGTDRGPMRERTSASRPTPAISRSSLPHSMLDLFISLAGRTEA